MAAVIAKEEDQSVLLESGGFQLIEDPSDRFVQGHNRRDRVGAGGVAGKLGGVAGGFTWAGRWDLSDIDHLARGLSRFEVLRPNGRLVFINPLRLSSVDPTLRLESSRTVDLGGYDCRLEVYRKR